ncbi:PorT family protein [Flavobacterium sp. SM15]|uniref:PorT family protein n=1 Tax=Flavobacterium sp. SM15 TaxID=2908005 RepID=UPI001ED9E0CD|nr:PorT family protein [Flavobacterium sp. SM15]MCG2610400.1 PorT family protein [Flavobacterium sp. SM15]
MKKLLIITLLLGSGCLFAQYGYRDGNRIGILGGVTQTNLMTSDFNTKPELGWGAGLQVRGNYYNNFSMIFGMLFSENNFSVETVSPLLKKEEVKYKLMGAQIRLLLSYNVVKDHVSLDFGPVLMVNDKFKIDKKYENNLVNSQGLTAKEITDINKINGNIYVGLSAGNRRVRFLVNYQYGMNNILNHLNKKDELKVKNNNSAFSGHVGILSGQLLFNL